MPRVMHQHSDRVEILLVFSGEGQYSIDGVSYSAKSGDILVYNRGAIHDECASPEAEMLVYSLAATNIKLEGRMQNQIIPDYFSAVFPSGPMFADLQALFEIIYRQTSLNTARSTETANYLLRAMIVMLDNLIRQQTKSIVSDDKALGQEIKNYLDTNFLDDLNLGLVAHALHINQFYLSHIFKEYSGYSPMQYVIRRRIGEAQSLLLNTNYGVTKIASLVGYNNINHFHSIFVKIVGMAPGKYRKSWTEKH
ncbi:MAG: AraC family transcriptional regulator [Eubacteriales bacterium]|nr:AraC family transcriptional regulator [Eubacteriales bacterium]